MVIWITMKLPQNSYIRAFTMKNAILSYFTIPKNYFINYTILFYNIPNIPFFIYIIYSLKY